MKTIVDQLANYAAYHRDRRNIATHFFGVPMILFAVVILLSRPVLIPHETLSLSPAAIIALVLAFYYLKLDRQLGLLMSIVLLLALIGASPLAAGPTRDWLLWGIGLFVVGWIIQAVGHVWEGRKPAFFDDLIGLVIGPLFVVTELVFLFGGRPELKEEVERRAGPSRWGRALKV